MSETSGQNTDVHDHHGHGHGHGDGHGHDHAHDHSHDHTIGHIHDHGHGHDHGSAPGFSAQIIAVLWLLTGVLVLALLATGRIATYIRTFWHPLTFSVAILIIVLSVSVLWRGFRQERASGVDKVVISPIAILLFVPFLLVIAGSPSPLGAAMLDNTASGIERDQALGDSAGRAKKVSGGHANFSPLSDTEVNELTMDDLHNRYSYGELSDLEGKRVKVVGFISHGGPASFNDDASAKNKSGDKTVKINRYKIFCCAADAVAYSATIAGAPDIAEDTWVELVGTVDTAASTSHLVLTPESVKETNEPRIPYL